MIIFVICIMIIVLMMTIILMMRQKHTSELYEVKNRLDMPARVLYRLNPLSPEETETHMLLHNDLVQRNPALIGFINNHSTRFPSSPIALAACLRFQEMSVWVERSRHQWSLTKLYTWISQWFYWWNVSLELLGRSRTTTSSRGKTARWRHWRRHPRMITSDMSSLVFPCCAPTLVLYQDNDYHINGKQSTCDLHVSIFSRVNSILQFNSIWV